MARIETTYRKRLKPLFRPWDDRDVATQLIRVIVLYEDLRLEYTSFYEDKFPNLDKIQSRALRRLYFLRRIYATLYEMWRGLDKLDRSKEFRPFLEKQGSKDYKNWRTAHRFLKDNKKTVDDRRHQYGGHFDEKAASFVLDNMHEDTEGTVIVTLDNVKHTASVVLRFAVELVAQSTTFDKPEDADLEHFVKGSHAFVEQAMKHATMAIEVILYGLVWSHFGIERRKQLEIKDTRKLRAKRKALLDK